MKTCTTEPAAVPQVKINALSRVALRGAQKAFETPAFRAEFEVWEVMRRETCCCADVVSLTEVRNAN
jgi:hypothetical protein